jgi:hypothetical protein
MGVTATAAAIRRTVVEADAPLDDVVGDVDALLSVDGPSLV